MYEPYERPEQLKAKFQIGSVNGRMNFLQNSKAFHTSDIPQNALKKKLETLEFKDPDYLKLKKPNWNTSTQTKRIICERKDAQISERDLKDFEYNYRAETLKKKDKIYLPKPNKFQFDRLRLFNEKEREGLCDKPNVLFIYIDDTS